MSESYAVQKLERLYDKQIESEWRNRKPIAEIKNLIGVEITTKFFGDC